MHTCLRATMVVCAAAVIAAYAQKNYKNQGEYEIYNEVTKDFAGNQFAKALVDLDRWKQQYPDSDYRNDRQILYVQAYAETKQPAKAVDAAGPLLSGDFDAAAGNAANAVKLLFTAAMAMQQVPDPTPEQLALGNQVAHRLLTYDKKPEAVADGDWQQIRSQLQAAANATLLYGELVPGTQAMKKNDCHTAESALNRALGDYPESSQAAWLLGTAELCLYKTQPEKASAAIYELARAAAVDPVKGNVDPKWQRETVEAYLEKVYAQYHGADPDGLAQLKKAALASPFPPAGFQIKSLSEIALDKQAEFEKSNPQLALWIRIKAALADAGGDRYFTANLKDSAVPQLRGVLIEARPACRPKELLVAVPVPDTGQPLQAEVTLKLDKPLTGSPALNTDLRWEGVPNAFTPTPFMLTMDTESAKIEGLRTKPCAARPPR